MNDRARLHLLIAVLLAAAAVECGRLMHAVRATLHARPTAAATATPRVTVQAAIPLRDRVPNWNSDPRWTFRRALPRFEPEGSCVHATLCTLLNWQGRRATAAWWRTHHAGGCSAPEAAAELDRARLKWAATTDGDERFLEWATRTRRACAVTVQAGQHMVVLAHLDDRRAGLIDPNAPDRIDWRDRAEFVHEWRASTGWAVTFIYDPPPPAPQRSHSVRDFPHATRTRRTP